MIVTFSDNEVMNAILLLFIYLFSYFIVYRIFAYSVNCTFWYNNCIQMPASGIMVVERGLREG